ncbi:type IV secretion protein Rhs [Entomohabitans teleogrylli]|uniref:type IV secretion protein Rhs n=1 Tax=Entomohabitans teleogrylli TaxID=1384589 RepID=UPI000AB48431|nr:type IV secretion protein Rhs [Entomohabitans teleogrylli]
MLYKDILFMTDDMEIKEGTLRLLTTGEIRLSRSVFGNSIKYNQVWVHCDSYFPFGLQNPKYAMAPNGELWFREELYRSDFSLASINEQHTFIHEMAHVWQRYNGMWVRVRGLFSWAADYKYRLDGKKLLKDYSMEQQASIIADYWLLRQYGHRKWLDFTNRGVNFQGVSDENIITMYEQVLSQFLEKR